MSTTTVVVPPRAVSSGSSRSGSVSGSALAVGMVVVGGVAFAVYSLLSSRRRRAAASAARLASLPISDETRVLFQNYEVVRLTALGSAGTPVPFVSDAMIAQRVFDVYDACSGIHSYRCVEEKMFMQPRIAGHPFWWPLTGQVAPSEVAATSVPALPPKLAALNLGERRVLDVGCCFGTDLRVLICAGFHPRNLMGIDIQPTFIDLGVSAT